MLRNIYVKRDETVFKSIEQFSLIITDQIGFRYLILFLKHLFILFEIERLMPKSCSRVAYLKTDMLRKYKIFAVNFLNQFYFQNFLFCILIITILNTFCFLHKIMYVVMTISMKYSFCLSCII